MKSGAFTAIVLAADRKAADPLVDASGACCKAMVKIDGIPMLERVVSALMSSAGIGAIVISGRQEQQLQGGGLLAEALAQGAISWTEPHDTPSTSAYRALQSLAAGTPVLVTTADHPLLRADIVDDFLQRSLATGADVGVGLTDFASIRARFPAAKKTVTRFRDGGYCGCNLFTFMTPASHRVAAAWRRVEQQRKNPLRVISQLGWWSVLRYLLGWMTLKQALEKLSSRLGVRIAAVHLPYPEAAIDVDSIADQQLVETITGSAK
jgi:GTP:adenosylcobinamide-phosphate guanylyltransferase